MVSTTASQRDHLLLYPCFYPRAIFVGVGSAVACFGRSNRAFVGIAHTNKVNKGWFLVQYALTRCSSEAALALDNLRRDTSK